jgi:hypothetical protein
MLYSSNHLYQFLPYYWLNLQWQEMGALLIIPAFNKYFACPPSNLCNLLMFSHRSFYPPLSFIRHHDYLVPFASVLVPFPWHFSISKIDPELRMLGGYVFQFLGWVSELECLEDVVLVYPVMCLLVERTTRKRVADIKDVAIHLLVGMR